MNINVIDEYTYSIDRCLFYRYDVARYEIAPCQIFLVDKCTCTPIDRRRVLNINYTKKDTSEYVVFDCGSRSYRLNDFRYE